MERRNVQDKSIEEQLISTVLKWSAADIVNENMLVEHVLDIPMQFSNVKQYQLYFRWPLIEEVRANLQQGIENMRRTPLIVLKGVRRKPSSSQLSTFRAVVKADSHSFMPKDVIMFVNCSGSLNQRLALITSKENDTVVHAVTYGTLSIINGSTYTCIRLANLVTALRIWTALHRPPSSIFQEIIIQGSTKLLSGSLKGAQLRYAQAYRLNDRQLESITTTLAGVETKKPHVQLIQGPPGTGKTSMLVAMLSLLCTSGKRVLMCAPTNAAVAEVMTRFVKHVDDKSGPFGKIRKGFSSADVVLLGSDDRLGIRANPTLAKVFLDEKLAQLSQCKLWLQCANEMVDFQDTAEEKHSASQTENETTTFSEFVTAYIQKLFVGILESIEIAIEYLPSCLLNSKVVKTVRKRISRLLKRLKKKVDDSEAREWFKPDAKGGVGEELRTLIRLFAENQDLLKPRYGQKNMDKERMLLRHAALVSCTVSTAGKDVVQQAGPFDVVVVDEASQLTEAETFIVMGLSGLKTLVLVGDQNQLPAVVQKREYLEDKT